LLVLNKVYRLINNPRELKSQLMLTTSNLCCFIMQLLENPSLLFINGKPLTNTNIVD